MTNAFAARDRRDGRLIDLHRGRSLIHSALGLVLGAVAGIAPLVLGTMGAVLIVPVVIWMLLDRPRWVALSGGLVGAALAWLVPLTVFAQSCAQTPTASCGEPDVTPLVVLAAAMLLAGAALGVAVRVRGGQRARPGSR